MAVALVDLLDEKQVMLQLRARDLPAALSKIVGLLAANGKIDNSEEFLEQLLARERAKPSAVEHGVAFPHARTDLVDQIVIGIGRSRAGVPFMGSDRANLLFVIGVPQRLVNDYLICIGTLARLMQDHARRASLMRARTPAEFVSILRAVLE